MKVQKIAIAATVGLLALGVYLWQLTVPQFLSFNDSGIYFAAAVHFVAGVFPYRNFTFVQPPGIVLVMSPVALISRLIGTHDGFILARVLTSCVTALNVSLLALLVRHRGRIAMIIAGVGLALLPVVFFVSSSVKLEPYCICLVLLGSLVILRDEPRDRQPSTKSLVLGGVLFGLAGLIKLWAFFPFIALAICLAPHARKRVTVFVGSASGSFVVLALPFLLLAPKNFVSQVFVEQLTRKASPGEGAGILYRLIDLTGLANTSVAPSARVVVPALTVVLVMIAIAFKRRLELELTDHYLLLAGAIATCGLLVAPEFYLYYGYFTAPLLVGVIAVSIARLGVPIRAVASRVKLSKDIRRLVSWSTVVAGVLVVSSLTLYTTTFYTNYARYLGINGPYLAPVNKVIPAGSCVVYSRVIYGVYSNRLQSNNPSCPSVVDATGMWMGWGYQLTRPAKTFVDEWMTYFEGAQYVVLNTPKTTFVPWNRRLTHWFATHYHLIYGNRCVFIYGNNAKT